MKPFLSALLLIINIAIYCQNLIQNPGFEEYSICPDNPYQISYCNYWQTFRQSPDYFNVCTSNNMLSIPENGWGYQNSHSGNAYIGFVFYNDIDNFHEFAASNLKNQLIIGQKYFVTLYVSLAYNITNGDIVACNNLGIKFSSVQYDFWNPAPVDNIAQFYTDSIITDTTNWVRLSGSFVADSAYNYIIIGNFFSSSLTDTISLNGNPGLAYYYIDDVCLTTDSLYNVNWTGIKENIQKDYKDITIYPNPSNGLFEISTEKDNVIDKVMISDATGRSVYSGKSAQNSVVVNLPELPTGPYYVSVLTNGKTLYKKLIMVN